MPPRVQVSRVSQQHALGCSREDDLKPPIRSQESRSNRPAQQSGLDTHTRDVHDCPDVRTIEWSRRGLARLVCGLRVLQSGESSASRSTTAGSKARRMTNASPAT